MFQGHACSIDIDSRVCYGNTERGNEPWAQANAVSETGNEPRTPGYDMKSDIGVNIFHISILCFSL